MLADLSSKGLAGLSRRSAGGSKLGAAGAASGTLPAGASSRIIEASSAPAGYSLAKHSGGSGGALPGTPEDAQLEGAESGKLPGAAGTAVEGTPAAPGDSPAAGAASANGAQPADAAAAAEPKAAAKKGPVGWALGWWALAVIACNVPDPSLKPGDEPPKGLRATCKHWGKLTWHYFVK